MTNQTEFENALLTKSALTALLDEKSAKMQKFPKMQNGLTSDGVKNSHDYKIAKDDFDSAMKKLQSYNSWFLRYYKKEYKAHRKKIFRG